MIEGDIYQRDVVTWEDLQGQVRTGVAVCWITGPVGPTQVLVVDCVDDLGPSAVLGKRWHVMRQALLTREHLPDMLDLEEVEAWLER